jgi:putative FmdB family regulatory protein
MPHYDYKCDDCGKTFEAFQNMSDAPLTSCILCGGTHVTKLFSPGGGVIFKGSGFYQTDYKNASAKKSEGESSTKQDSTCSNCPAAEKCPSTTS